MPGCEKDSAVDPELKITCYASEVQAKGLGKFQECLIN